MKKQILLFILMLMPLMMSAYDAQIDGIYYFLNRETNEAVVTHDGIWNTHEYQGDVVIPSTVSVGDVNYTVTSIGSYAFEKCSITSVTIPNSVTTIEYEAFQQCI